MRRGNKFGARTVKTGVGTFDSKKEFNRWLELRSLERAGKISGLKRQVEFKLWAAVGDEIEGLGPTSRHWAKPAKTKTGRDMLYVADFTYTEGDELVIEDCKGMMTELARLKIQIVGINQGRPVKIT